MTSPGKVFKESSDQTLLRAFSAEADSMTQSAIGAQMTPSQTVIFILNSLTGLSLLTLPYGFSQAGLVLGAALLFACMALAFVTATFMCEALTIANALTYEEAERKVIEQKPELRQKLHDERQEFVRNSGKDLAQQLLPHGATVADFVSEVQRENAVSEFKIRERVELGPLGEMVLRQSGKRAMADAIYLMVVVFTYGTASALAVTVNSSLSHTFCAAKALATNNEDCDDDAVYSVCVIISFFITLPLCFANLQKTKKFTQVIMMLRFIAIAIMLAVATWMAAGRVAKEGSTAVLKTLPMWHSENFMSVFGNAVFLFGIHHYLPSMISPLEPQTKAPCAIATAFLSCYVLIVGVCATALVAWGGETQPTCSDKPGGHFCSVQPLYNLNFAPLPGLGGAVAIFLTSYPAMAIASIPIAAITTRNTMARWLGITLPDPDKPFTFNNVVMTLAVLMPPSIVALITKNVQAVIKYVGGYAGLTVAILCPLLLVIKCREALRLSTTDRLHEQRPLKSPFGNLGGYIFVIVFYVLALVLVTKQLFF
mmetsp:Transcript_132720/g.343433  ORF Transcript_132720/g.343433 Transcript_132720/m.343433 type:complete len:540 (+) Transcript_132720:65-1684(+)